MSISGVGTNVALMVQSLIDLRSQLDNLQRQLSTGEKVTNYAGLGSQADLVVGLNMQLASIGGFQNNDAILNTRLDMAQTALTQFNSVRQEMHGTAILSTYNPVTNGQTIDQMHAAAQFDQLLNLLNTQADNRYLFAGRAVDKPAVAPTDQIINGIGTQAGLKQIISERNQADLGANGLGRLVIPAVSTSPARMIGTGATLAPDAPAIVAGLADISGLSSLGGTLVINATNITINPGDNAVTIMNAINLQLGVTGVSASINATNQLVLTSADADTAVDVGAGTSANLLTELGLAAVTTNPTNLLTQGAVFAGQTLTITVGANPMLSVPFGNGLGQVSTLAELATALSGLAGGTATVDTSNGNITITALGTPDTITVGGTVTPGTFGIPAALAGPAAGTRVSLSEDVAGSVFGFKLAGVASTLTGANVIGPSGAPPGITVDLTKNPNPGDSLKFTFNLPDGATADLTLKATATLPVGKDAFLIGATPAATAANLQAALTTSVGTLAKTELEAASAVAAAHNFFDIDLGQPPQRVAGPPFTTATALVNGTPLDTVSWYLGEMSASPPRDSAVARIDPTVSISYGMRANEQALRSTVENVAVFAVMGFQANDPNSTARYSALGRRIGLAMSDQPGTQTVTSIEAEIANAQIMIRDTSNQQKNTQAMLLDLVQGVTGVSNEEVAAKLLAVSTQLQASLQTTAMLSKISLVNYL